RHCVTSPDHTPRCVRGCHEVGTQIRRCDVASLARLRGLCRGTRSEAAPSCSSTVLQQYRSVAVPQRQWKESPQAQEPEAAGLSIVKPCFSIVSTKSMVAPYRYGTLIRSTTTDTPSKSRTSSPSRWRSSKNNW